MPKEITMPALSPSMSEGTLARWLKKEGDEIKVGDVIAEVETDKATMDLESFEAGTLLKIVVPDGTNVTVNARIAFIGKPGEKIDEALLASAPAPAAPAPAPSPPCLLACMARSICTRSPLTGRLCGPPRAARR